MIVVRTRTELERALEGLDRIPLGEIRRPVGLVPTMGYLHAGHEALLTRSKDDGCITVLSVFVNPLQFGPNEDFDRYPRDEARDLEIADRAGTQVAYLPDPEDLLPQVPRTVIRVPSLMERMCAPNRPGHFEGVAAIVVRLLSVVRPDVAYFGEKDSQQLAIVRQVVDDLRIPVRIVGVATVREPDGVAMSSRNAYLREDERGHARALYRGLTAGRRAIDEGERDPARVGHLMREVLASEFGVRPEYAEVTEPDHLQVPARIIGRTLLAVAARVGNARLIDNLRLWVPLEGLSEVLVDDPTGVTTLGAEDPRVERARSVLERVLGPGFRGWAADAAQAFRGAADLDPATVRAVLGGIRTAAGTQAARPAPEALDQVAALIVSSKAG